MKRTDSDWERWGANSPYYGVISVERFRGSKLAADSENEFFSSGQTHVANVLALILSKYGSPFSPERVLDFGCGVGRLTIPFANAADCAVGVDISDSMLAAASRNSATRGVSNISFVKSDDDLEQVAGDFDLVHSYIVLQHIHPQRGYQIINRLADKVRAEGFIAIQIYSSCNAHPIVRGLSKARYLFPPANWIRNILKRRPMLEQAMQLHIYDLSRVLRILRTAGFPEITLCLDTEASGTFESTFLLARRTKLDPMVTNPLA